MGRKRTHKRPLTRAEMGERGAPVWQQSQALNSQAYSMAYSQMLNIALSRFKWLNLPKLATRGFSNTICCISVTPRSRFRIANRACFQHASGDYFEFQRLLQAEKWDSYGINGWRFRLTIPMVFSSTLTAPVRHSFRLSNFRA